MDPNSQPPQPGTMHSQSSPLSQTTEPQQVVAPPPLSQEVLDQELPHSSSFLPKMLLRLFAVIIVFGLIGGAYYLGTQKNTPIMQKKPIAVSPTHAVMPTSNPLPTVDPATTNWQIYTSAFFGFSLKYPQNWKVLDQKSTNTYNEGAKRNLQYSFTQLGLSNSDITLNIELSESPFVTPIPVTGSNKLTLQGTDASFATHFEEGPMPARGYWSWLSFTKNGKGYSLYMVSPEQKGSQEALMRTILSTFTFTQ